MGNLPSWCVFLLTDLTGEETDPFCPLLSGRQTVRRTSDQPHDLRHRPFVHNSRLPRFHRRYRATAVCCKKKTCLMTFSVLWRLWVWLSDCLLLHHSYHSSWFLHLKDFLVQQSLDAFAHQASPQGFLRASRPMSSMFAFFLVEFGKDTAEDDITEIMFEVWARSNVF